MSNLQDEKMDWLPQVVDGLYIYRMQLPTTFGTRSIYIKEDK